MCDALPSKFSRMPNRPNFYPLCYNCGTPGCNVCPNGRLALGLPGHRACPKGCVYGSRRKQCEKPICPWIGEWLHLHWYEALVPGQPGITQAQREALRKAGYLLKDHPDFPRPTSSQVESASAQQRESEPSRLQEETSGKAGSDGTNARMRPLRPTGPQGGGMPN